MGLAIDDAYYSQTGNQVDPFAKFCEVVSFDHRSYTISRWCNESKGRIHLLERYMNTRKGITRKDDTLPERILKEARKSDKKKRLIPLKPMLENYYKIRGYDENGVPKSSRLKKLGITIK